MIYVVWIAIYLAIGGILAGIFDELDIDAFWWYVFWPAGLLVILIVAMEIPFERFGSNIRDRLRTFKDRKQK